MPKKKRYSDNDNINLLIKNMVEQICPYLEEQARQISDLTAIGRALSSRKKIKTVLKMILTTARRFTRADGGTLYLVDPKHDRLIFHVIQNESLNIDQTENFPELPDVELYHPDQTPNLSNVSSYCFHTRKTINLKNVYQTKRFDFSKTRKFDARINNKSQSMLVIPMKSHENDMIGVLQLINAMDLSARQVVPFSNDAQKKTEALAGQAAVLLTQQRLIDEMSALFEAFISAIAVSIDEKSKHTGWTYSTGH
jgi:GAF domain-containing protein